MKTLLFLGDSITDCDHFFDPLNLGFGYVSMISRQLHEADQNCQIHNLGCNGFTVPAVRRLWKRSCLTFKPDGITILIGINDLGVIKNTGITPSVGLAQFREQYQALLEDIRVTTDCPITLIEPFIFPHPAEYQSWEEDLYQMNQIIQTLALNNDLSFLPLLEILLNAAKQEGFQAITTDGIHLTPYGHQLLTDQWIRLHWPLPS